MGRMMASGEAVPIASLEGVTASQAELLEAKGITDVEKLAATSVDNLVDTLDVSLDEAERILSSAAAIVAAKEEQESVPEETAGSDEPVPEADSAEQPAAEAPDAADDAATAYEDGVDVEQETETSLETAGSDSEADNKDELPDESITEAADEAASQEPETPADEER
jgi:hypothetical protein